MSKSGNYIGGHTVYNMQKERSRQAKAGLLKRPKRRRHKIGGVGGLVSKWAAAEFKPEQRLIKRIEKPQKEPQEKILEPSPPPWRGYACWLLEYANAKLKKKDRRFLQEIMHCSSQPSLSRIWRIERIYADKGPRRLIVWRA
jgi:hypothetical protein